MCTFFWAFLLTSNRLRSTTFKRLPEWLNLWFISTQSTPWLCEPSYPVLINMQRPDSFPVFLLYPVNSLSWPWEGLPHLCQSVLMASLCFGELAKLFYLVPFPCCQLSHPSPEHQRWVLGSEIWTKAQGNCDFFSAAEGPFSHPGSFQSWVFVWG